MLTVVLGGARSGKSALAERLASQHAGPVTFVATCPRIEGDAELEHRIARHRGERPPTWTTVEEEHDLAAAIGGAAHTAVIVDCLTLWVSNLLFAGGTESDVLRASEAAIDATRRRTAPTVVVSNEVGFGIVPADAATRAYRDVLGRVNQQWVSAADRALLLVAGRALDLRPPEELL